MNSARTNWLRALVLFGVALAGTHAAAQTAGRVLLAAGEVSVLRAGTEIALATGAEIMTGDIVRTGEASSAQLRFTDAGIVAMRAKSRFHVADYRFTGADDGVSGATFALLEGGLRTLTGLIGRGRQDRYRMATPLASVGIRGTTYALVYCQKDCEDDEGGIAADGAYGLVFEGRVAVANAGGEREFGPEEAFFVADASTPAQALATRPRFLRDRLEARARREERREQIEARQQAIMERREQVAKATAVLDARLGNVAVAGAGSAPIVVADLRDSSGNIALFGVGLGAGVAFSTVNAPYTVVDGGKGTVIQLDAERGFVDRFSFNDGAQAGDRQTAPVLDSGRIEGDGGAIWGRWGPGAVVSAGGFTGAPSTGVHFFFGALTPESLFGVVPAAATAVRYEYAGGPRPTDERGNAGQFLAGSFIVNFLQRSISGTVSYSVDAVTYSLPVPNGTALNVGRGFIGFNVVGERAGSWSCACNNTGGILERYAVSGLFLGSRAQGIGVSFGTEDNRLGRTAGVGIFRCVSGGCR